MGIPLLALPVIHDRLANLVPVARDVIVEKMSDAVLVFDEQNRLVDFNPAAYKLLEFGDNPPLGFSINSDFSDYPHLATCFQALVNEQNEVTLHGSPDRYLDLRVSKLYSRDNLYTGQVLVVRDVTERKTTEQAIRQQTELLKATIENMDSGIIFIDNSWKLMAYNQKFTDIFSLNNAFLSVHPDFSALVEHMLDQETGKDSVLEIEISEAKQCQSYSRELEAGKRVIEMRHSPLTTGGFVRTFTDITERKRMERDLLVSNQEAQMALDREQRINELSQTLTKALDIDVILKRVTTQAPLVIGADGCEVGTLSTDRKELIFASPFLGAINLEGTISPKVLPRSKNGKAWQVLRTGKSLLLAKGYAPDTNEASSHISAHSIIIVPLQTGEKPNGVLVFINTENKRTFNKRDLAMAETIGRQAAVAIETASLFRKVNQLAQTDPLTGLFNRGHFMTLAEHELNQSMRYQRPMTLIMLDIDHFKRINDNYGHATGDRVLKAVAQIARECIRASDAICRYGGEEFIIMLPETDQDQAFIVAERLRLRVSNHVLKSRHGPITTTVSLGVAVIESDGNNTIDQAIECADQAMYAAKQAGRDQTIVFDAIRCSELAKTMRKGINVYG